MNKQEFTELLRDPSKLSSSNIPLLEEVIKNFPYCQPAHILLARAAHQGGSMLAEQKMKKAAAYALDRKKLKKFILDKIQLKETTLTLPKLEVVQEAVKPKPEVTATVHNQVKELVQEVIQPKPEVPSEIHIPEVKQEVKNEPSPVIPEPALLPKNDDSDKTISSSNKEDFYKELEENLKKLHQLKEGISKSQLEKDISTPEVKKGISEAKPEKDISIPKLEKDISIPEAEKEVSKSKPEKQISKPKPRTISKFAAPEEEPQAAPLPPLPIFLPKKAPENIEFKYEKPIEAINKPTIPQRQELEEELASEEKQLPADSDLLLNYLSYLDANRQKRDRKKEEEIIEKFIKEDPSIPYLTPGTPTEATEDLSEKSTKISKTPVSENFARILLLQGKRDKALEIYEELMLKYPEKRAYFASKIEELKK